MSEADVLSMVNVIAAKHNMTIEIDFDNQIINFNGEYNKETEASCAKDLAKIFGE